MTEAVVSATAFEAERGALMRLAYRMLGTRSDAEDMVQETYLRAERLARVPDNLPAWLTRTIYVVRNPDKLAVACSTGSRPNPMPLQRHIGGPLDLRHGC